jgi:hypothetical protein
MKFASISVAMPAALSVVIWTLDASARPGAGGAAWAEAAARCRAQVQAQYPTAQEESQEMRRAYQACLATGPRGGRTRR